MSEEATQPKGEFEVGYGKPPVATRFQKGRSGNPTGRPRKRNKTVEELILQESYRPIVVTEGGKRKKVKAIEAVLRGQIALAAKGNGPAQRAVIRFTQGVEDRRLAEKNEALEWAVKYKLTAEKLAWERAQAGLPEDNNPSRPRPDDLVIIPQTGEVIPLRRDYVLPQLSYDPSKKPANLLDDLKPKKRR